MRNLALILFFSVFSLASEEDLINKISKILPTGLPINFIEESSMPDFYVVNVANNQILYVSKDFKFVLAGEVIALNDGEITSLNDIYENKFIKNIISSIKPNESIDFISNNERYKLKIFTDVSCSYCRLLHSEIDQYLLNGITISYLAFPRDGLDSKVYKDMVSVWCSLDPKDSLNKLKKGESIENKNCKNPVKEHFRKGSLIGITGTPTIILEDGTKFSGYIPANELIKILESG
jgi:thiol:disulfide interchange protein DsbC